MSKPVFALIVGGVLGIFDGLTALFSAPETRPQILTIVFFSMIKGVITGLLIGIFSRKVNSLPLGILFGLAVGLLLAYLVAMNPDPVTGKHYYWEIMLPGAILGIIVGFAAHRHEERRPALA